MLEVEHVRRSFGQVEATRDVSFRVPQGTTFGLLGPNGAGKTTTMRMILGIVPPDAGEIRWAGSPIGTESRRRFGYLPEERGLYAKMRVREHVIYFARLHGLTAADAAARAQRWLEDLQLVDNADRACGELSKGNQQKVQVACAAVHEPEMLVLDEPFAGLDPMNAEMLMGTLVRLRRAGTTLVLSSHQLWQLESLCDAFCIIAAGETRAAGTLTELRAGWPTATIVVAPPTDASRRILLGLKGAKPLASPTADGTLRVQVSAEIEPAALLRDLVAAGTVNRFERVEASLDDIYRRAVAVKETAAG